MPVSTDKLIPGVLPPKEPQSGIDFVQILDSFDPSTLSRDVLDVLASRNPYLTAYGSEVQYYEYKGVTRPVPDVPAESRLRTAGYHFEYDRDNLVNQSIRYEAGVPNAYKNCRRDLIKAIGSKACLYIVEQEMKALTPEDCRQQKTEYARWEIYSQEYWEEQEMERQRELLFSDIPASRSEKVISVRKGIRNSSGRCFSQRDFAKLIGYPILKYAAAEKHDDLVEDELLEKLIMICHANPYFLYDDECEAFMGEYNGSAVDMGDAPAIIVDLGVIYKWIRAGRPQDVSWLDGVTEKQRAFWD